MKKKIIIGCPYTSMENIAKALDAIADNNILLVNSKDVNALDANCIYVGNKLEKHEILSFSSSFLRYPYDLIPPHSETYPLRENIEFYKSLALSFEKIAINSLSSTWILRNRLFSLKQAKTEGVRTSDFILIHEKESMRLLNKNIFAVKAIGNCFVATDMSSFNESFKSFLKIEKESNGDIASIFPASLLKKKEIEKYLANIGVAFLQWPVESCQEYRCYIIGNDSFSYLRESYDSFDKSAAKYYETEYTISSKTLNGLKKLMKRYKLNYLCFDIICDDKKEETVIDINPYGSMPEYEEFSTPSIKLAELLMNS